MDFLIKVSCEYKDGSCRHGETVWLLFLLAAEIKVIFWVDDPFWSRLYYFSLTLTKLTCSYSLDDEGVTVGYLYSTAAPSAVPLTCDSPMEASSKLALSISISSYSSADDGGDLCKLWRPPCSLEMPSLFRLRILMSV